ncbi:MAG: ABC transporter ATP-binding protein [Oscillospiraceae bacterium]|nr:ABC transporter ATP-binding protein [Oscillospiraceae bacterium]
MTALDALTTQINAGSIYGLVGSNGAGKSTFLRLIAGVYRPDGGTVEFNGQEVFENEKVKSNIFFLADELYFPPAATINSLAQFYKELYPNWSDETFKMLCGLFPLDANKKLEKFSKGMRRQAALIIALSCRPQLMLLDEAFDGLDPVIRTLLRKLLADDVAQRGSTIIIASHNLRELEDFCDQVGVLHKGRILFQKDIDELHLGFCKVQCAFKPAITDKSVFGALQLLKCEIQGSVVNLVARGSGEAVAAELEKLNPLFVESVPLTLEEVFIHEMEAVGYDHSTIIF